MNIERLTELAEFTKANIAKFDMRDNETCFKGMAYQMGVGERSEKWQFPTSEEFYEYFGITDEQHWNLCMTDDAQKASPENALLTLNAFIETGEIVW